MKSPLSHYWFATRIVCGLALAAAATSAFAAGDASPAAAPAQIAHLLSATYDGPGKHVVTEAVAIVGEFATADWTQREMAGRALLRHKGGRWTIVACGGDALKDLAWLKDAGVPAPDARVLLARLVAAERPMGGTRVARFDRFRMPADAPPAHGAAAHIAAGPQSPAREWNLSGRSLVGAASPPAPHAPQVRQPSPHPAPAAPCGIRRRPSQRSARGRAGRSSASAAARWHRAASCGVSLRNMKRALAATSNAIAAYCQAKAALMSAPVRSGR